MSEIIAGRNSVLEALKSGRIVEKIVLAGGVERRGAIEEILRLAQSRSVPVEETPREVLNQTSPVPVHQGVLAYVGPKESVSLDDLLSTSQQIGELPLYVVLDGIEDPQNFGSILRTADASGVHGVITRTHRAVGLTAAVARASAGAIEYVPVVQVANISQAIEFLKKNNVWVAGIDPHGKTSYTRADFTIATAIVIGAEGKGISDLVKKRCDYLVSLPMRGKIASLNAAVAAAIVMYEALRQRSK